MYGLITLAIRSNRRLQIKLTKDGSVLLKEMVRCQTPQVRDHN
jgi:hypothetical protein